MTLITDLSHGTAQTIRGIERTPCRTRGSERGRPSLNFRLPQQQKMLTKVPRSALSERAVRGLLVAHFLGGTTAPQVMSSLAA